MVFPFLEKYRRLVVTLPKAILVVLTIGLLMPLTASAVEFISESTATGFKFPESVAYDPNAKVLYVSEFGSELKPTQKDGAGRISKVSLTGEVLESQFLPAPGKKLNKPKGIWVAGNHLWVTDIDGVWIFDLKTKAGQKIDLPGAQFANDPTIVGNTLFVSDNRSDQLFSVTPADFMRLRTDPVVKVEQNGNSVNPNGVAPGSNGSLLMVGFKSGTEPRAIYSMAPGGTPTSISENIGRLDGVYQISDGELLVTDWDSGSLLSWSASGGKKTLASGFKGPADFAVFPSAGGMTVVVPDLVKSELRFVKLSH